MLYTDFGYHHRLQAQGTPGHPHHYSSAFDAARKTFQADGVRGFYKGLGPTLFKVSHWET